MISVFSVIVALSAAQELPIPSREPSVECAEHLLDARARQDCIDDLFVAAAANLDAALDAARIEADEIDLDTAGRMQVRASLDSAHTAWISYRDLECVRRSRLMILDPAGLEEFSTACQIRLTRARTTELQAN
jgi:uncharacterized protein YecT (DUF1311 family)